MNLKRTGSRWDRTQRININDNWDEIERNYTPLLDIGKDAENTLKEALNINGESKRVNKENVSVQNQINNILSELGEEGITVPELTQARIDSEGEEHNVLKERLDKEANKKQDKLIVLDELPSDLSSYPMNTLILTRPIYWFDDFRGNQIDTEKWHVYESEVGIITQDYQLKLESLNPVQTAHAYGKNPVRKDIDGRFNVRLESLTQNTQSLLDLYQWHEELYDTPTKDTDRIITFTNHRYDGIQMRVRTHDGELSWEGSGKSWESHTGPVATNIPYEMGDILNCETKIIDDYLLLSIENETQGHLERAAPIPLSDIFGSYNKLYPYIADLSEAVNRGIIWHEVSYKRVGDQ